MTPPNLTGIRKSDAGVNLFGIQGEPNTGKTYAALTFPNPVVLNFDKKLPDGIYEIPFYDDNFIHSINGVEKNRDKVWPNRRGALLKWLRDNASSVTKEITLVIDSYTTGIDNMHNLHVVNNTHLFLSKENSFNPLAGFQDKLLFNIELFHVLKSLNCRVVITFHEQAEREKTTGKPTGKFKPLATGQFKDQLAGHLGTNVRSVCERAKDGTEKYFWQVKSNPFFNVQMAPCYSIPPDIDRIPNDFKELEKFRKISPTVNGENQTNIT